MEGGVRRRGLRSRWEGSKWRNFFGEGKISDGSTGKLGTKSGYIPTAYKTRDFI